MDTRDVGVRIRRLRLIQQLDQAEFASRIGVASGSVSKIENGLAPLGTALADAIAETLNCSTSFLLSDVATPTPTRPWLRAYADASQRVVERQVGDCAIAYEVVESLPLKRIKDTVPTFAGDLNDDQDIEQFALDVRTSAGVGDGEPVGNSIRAAERLGCFVLPMFSELGRHLGLSVRVGPVPVIFVSRSSLDPDRRVPGDRQRFTVAHELGHLALHAALGPPQTAAEAALIEKQAHRFAGAFLAPGDAMLAELARNGGRVTLSTLSEIKRTWGVAIKALVMRYRQLSVIDDDHARSLYKQISARGWNTAEPVPVGNESAVWLMRALAKWGACKEDAALARASDASGVGIAHLQRWTEWSPTSCKRAADIVDLRERRSNRSNRNSALSAP